MRQYGFTSTFSLTFSCHCTSQWRPLTSLPRRQTPSLVSTCVFLFKGPSFLTWCRLLLRGPAHRQASLDECSMLLYFARASFMPHLFPHWLFPGSLQRSSDTHCLTLLLANSLWPCQSLNSLASSSRFIYLRIKKRGDTHFILTITIRYFSFFLWDHFCKHVLFN